MDNLFAYHFIVVVAVAVFADYIFLQADKAPGINF